MVVSNAAVRETGQRLYEHPLPCCAIKRETAESRGIKPELRELNTLVCV